MTASTGEGATARAARGRPRSEASKQAILRAAFSLLEERGIGDTSMEAVAARAGVSKTTIYRWWESKELLALDALYAEWDTAAPAPRASGTLRGDILALVRPWVRLAAAKPSARILIALMTAAADDPAFGDVYRARFVEPRRDQARMVFARAIDRGEIPASTDIEVAIDLMWGPLYHRLLHGHAPLSERYVRQATDAMLAGLLPREDSAQESPRSASSS